MDTTLKSLEALPVQNMPPPFVKKAGQVIHYYYAKLVMAPSAGMAGNYGFIVNRYNALERGEIQMSDYDRELWLKETQPQATCAYCGGPGPLVADHVIPLAISGPDSVHNIVRACRDCNGTKSDRDLIEWWNAAHREGIGPAKDKLPRLPAGIYLKFSHDWLRIQNRLELPARDLEDLRPFQSSRRGDAVPTHEGRAASPARRPRQVRDVPARQDASVQPEPVMTPLPPPSSQRPGVLETVLGSYLYKEEVQELARELELLASGTKDEISRRLLRDPRFDPNLALKFLDKDGLRQLCEDFGLATDGFLRGTLAERVLAAIQTEKRTIGKRAS